jgi:NTE family protein
MLSDGGVYDNMGLEPAWKRFKTLLVSNAGRPFGDLEAPPTDWLSQLRRVVDITMDQDQALRERILIGAYRENIRTGTLWGLNVMPVVPARCLPACLKPSMTRRGIRGRG